MSAEKKILKELQTKGQKNVLLNGWWESINYVLSLDNVIHIDTNQFKTV
jgi:hypothetical protein